MWLAANLSKRGCLLLICKKDSPQMNQISGQLIPRYDTTRSDPAKCEQPTHQSRMRLVNGIAVRPLKAEIGREKMQYKAGDRLYSVESGSAGKAFIQEWELRSVRRFTGFLTMKIDGLTYRQGRWRTPIHSRYKLQFSFFPGSRNPLPANFYTDHASAAANVEAMNGRAGLQGETGILDR